LIYLVDTNILLRVLEEQHPIHARLKTTVQRLTQEGHTLKMTTQNCVEFWNVATRPIDRNGFGLKVASANQSLAKLENIFPRLIDSLLIYDEWRRLVIKFEVLGVQVHDVRLVAAMRFYGITHILTMNTKDFKRYESEGIVAVDSLNLE
jgi:predicted nucleic acid-binding protein